MSADIAKGQRIVDPYNFIRAEDFFQGLDRPAFGGYRPTAVIIYEYNADAGHVNRDLHLRFDDGSGLAIRFVRPKIWKLHRDLGIGEEFGGPEHQSYDLLRFFQVFLLTNFPDTTLFSPRFPNLLKCWTQSINSNGMSN